MACPRCGAVTRAGQKFCADCGLALGTNCPNCGAPYEGSPRFCAECGHQLGGTTAGSRTGADAEPIAEAPAAERRFVSVLFADLVGFTSISEQHDSEEVRDLLSRYFTVAREVIAGYGGAVEKFIGDAVMAIWGAPIAREDDAERAVRAALELVDRARELRLGDQRLELRAAVHSGEAAVTAGRTGEGMVAGDLVNTASRLQSVAPPGMVLVGEATHQATSAAIAYEPAGEQLLKGKQAAVAAWRALRVVARVGGEGRDEGLEPPFSGRDEELRLLKDQLHAAERERKLRLISIIGQAGMGKSRLVWELEKYLDGLAGPVFYWHQGRSPSYGEGVTFWALGEMVRRRCRIAEGEDAASTRAKLRATLAEFVPDPEERRTLEPSLGALLGIDEADWHAREQLFSAWRTFFERIADRGTSILVFEDLQWADPGLLDFIEHILEWTRNKPILLITLARPEIFDRRPNWGVGHRSLIGLHLEPLPDEPMTALLHGLVPGMQPADVQKIVARAEGVPLYAVEMVRSLLDGGHVVRGAEAYELVRDLPELDIPPTLKALIASRLDGLDPVARALVADASVIGVVFALPVLAALTGRPASELETRLRALAQKELIALETDPRSPERGQYRFVQGLIREVAYGTLGKRDRRTRHLAVARHYEAVGDEELAGVLASHYLEAYRAAPEGPEGEAVAAQARVALRAAAERASRLHSHEQAFAYFEQALAVTFDGEEQVSVRISAARSARSAGRLGAVEDMLRPAIAWYRAQGDHTNAAQTTAQLAEALLSGSKVDEGMAALQAALTDLPPDAGRAAIDLYGQLARAHLFRGEPSEALTAVSRALDVAEELRLRTPALQLLITKAWALMGERHPREAVALAMGALRLADQEDDLLSRLRARINVSGFLSADDPHLALRIALEGVALAKQYGHGFFAGVLAGNAATSALLIGDLDRVLAVEADVGEVMNVAMTVVVSGWAAGAASLRGDAAGARDRMSTVNRAMAGTSSAQDLASQMSAQAIVAFGAGELTDARRLGLASSDVYAGGDGAIGAVVAARAGVLLGDAAALHSDRDQLEWRSIYGAWVDRARRNLEAGILALEGSPAEAAAAYRRVIDEWRSGGFPLDLGLTLVERAWLLGESDDEAAAGRDEALAIFAEMGAAGLVERLEAAAVRPAAAAPVPSRAAETVAT
jgi:class 3 adenylate cyclase/tetratricopeptide (TPR) repeat protein